MRTAVEQLAAAVGEMRELLAEPMVMPQAWAQSIADLDRRVASVVAHELQGEPLAPAALAELAGWAAVIVAELRRHRP